MSTANKTKNSFIKIPQPQTLTRPFGDPVRHYRDALYATLCRLRPTICLEIGTNYGGSSYIFQEYFNDTCNDGLLITVDIEKYTELNLLNVQQLILDSAKIKETFSHLSFDFVFIDGDHTRKGFLQDLNTCLSLDIPYILIDDTESTQEVNSAYNEIKHNFPHYDYEDWDVFVSMGLIKNEIESKR
jgi:hypothetical protein